MRPGRWMPITVDLPATTMSRFHAAASFYSWTTFEKKQNKTRRSEKEELMRKEREVCVCFLIWLINCWRPLFTDVLHNFYTWPQTAHSVIAIIPQDYQVGFFFLSLSFTGIFWTYDLSKLNFHPLKEVVSIIRTKELKKSKNRFKRWKILYT